MFEFFTLIHLIFDLRRGLFQCSLFIAAIGFLCISTHFSLGHSHQQLVSRRFRRSINSFMKDVGDGTRQNVILVQADNKGELIEELKKHLNHSTPHTHTHHAQQAISSESSSALQDEHLEEEDLGDSDVSEERNPEDLINSELSPVKLDDSEQRRPDDVVSIINNAFNNRKTFSCPKTKTDLVTGTSTANLSPEDIGFIGAMGDSLATGAGLWPRTDIEFRGAAFPIGGDATIDGLVTIPNILREFIESDELVGVSHGMGQRDQLPEHQLNVAESGALSTSMPDQARELVRRIKRLKEIDTWNSWALVIITIGTEEICKTCSGPNTEALIDALDILNRGIHKALVVLVGPIHVSSSYDQRANLLKKRCECSQNESKEFMDELSELWTNEFERIQRHMEDVKRSTFNALALPMLTVHSRYPYSVFIPNKPLLNRRGHSYATKWLWNRLIGGPKYNLSKAVLSQDAYFCPSLGCPYFRTTDNFNYCQILSIEESQRRKAQEERQGKLLGTRFGSREADLYATTSVIVCIAFISVLIFGTLFYRRSKKGNKGRFDMLPHGPPAHYRKTTVRHPTLLNKSNGDLTADDRLTQDLEEAGNSGHSCSQETE